MIYRNWSLLSSTVVIWGGVATAGLAGIFLLGGKVLPSPPPPACFACSGGRLMVFSVDLVDTSVGDWSAARDHYEP
jgi:hypothetical protein